MSSPSVSSYPTSRSSYPTQPPQLQGLASAVTNAATTIAPQTATGGPQYPAQVTAGLSPEQSSGIGIGNALAQYSLAGVPIATAEQLKTAMGGDLPSLNPDIQAIEASMRQQEGQQISSIENQWGGLGQGISTGLAKNLGEQNAAYGGAIGNLELGAYENLYPAQQAAVNAILGGGQQAYGNVMGAGSTEQNTQNAAFQAAYQQWLQQQGQGNTTLQSLIPLVQEAYGQQGIENVQAYSPLQSLGTLGGALLSNPSLPL